MTDEEANAVFAEVAKERRLPCDHRAAQAFAYVRAAQFWMQAGCRSQGVVEGGSRWRTGAIGWTASMGLPAPRPADDYPTAPSSLHPPRPMKGSWERMPCSLGQAQVGEGTKWLATAGLATLSWDSDRPAGGRYAGAFDRLRSRLGRFRFPTAVSGCNPPELGQPLVHGDYIYVGQAGTDGLHVRQDSGARVRTLELGAPVQSAPARDGVLVATDVSGTTVVWGSTKMA